MGFRSCSWAYGYIFSTELPSSNTADTLLVLNVRTTDNRCSSNFKVEYGEIKLLGVKTGMLQNVSHGSDLEGSCEHGNGTSGSKKGGEFLE